jgi:hypothetical protein
MQRMGVILNVAPERLAGQEPPAGWPICDSYPPRYHVLTDQPGTTTPEPPRFGKLHTTWQSESFAFCLLVALVMLVSTSSVLLNQYLSSGFGFQWQSKVQYDTLLSSSPESSPRRHVDLSDDNPNKKAASVSGYM